MDHRQHHRQSAEHSSTLDGDVFARQQRFLTLPRNLQEDVKQFRTFVEQDPQRLFQTHHHALVKSVYSVKGKDLIDAIIHWLQAHYASPKGQHAPEQTVPTAGLTAHAPAPSAIPVSTKSNVVTAEQLHCAKQVAEALVLVGFLTPYKDDNTHLSFIAPEHYVHDQDVDSELFIPVAPSVTDLRTTSVWSIADGAVYARALKRKAGVLGQLDRGKDVYVVLNDYSKKTYLFESDLAREPIAEMSGTAMRVELDSSHFEFGVRVSQFGSGREHDKPELFNAETKELQEEFVSACVHIGAKYEDYNGVTDRNQMNQMHEGVTAGIAGASISDPAGGHHSQTPHSVDFAGAPASMEREGRQRYSYQTSPAYQGDDGSGTYSAPAENQRHQPSVGERASSAIRGDHRHDGDSYQPSSSLEHQRQPISQSGGSNPTSMKNQGQYAGAPLTASEHQQHHPVDSTYPITTNHHGCDERGSHPTSTGEHHQNPTIRERVSSAMHPERQHDDSAYPKLSEQHQGLSYQTSSDSPGRDERGLYSTSADDQRQQPSVGERMTSAIHGNNRHDSGLNPTSLKHHGQSTGPYPNNPAKNDNEYVDAPYPEMRGTDASTMSKHNEYGADVHFAPHTTP